LSTDYTVPRTKTTSSTAQRILEAAEELFADRVFDAVSVRDITARAGVRLNLLAYYFKSKQALFDKVIDRRLETLNRRWPPVFATWMMPPKKTTAQRILDAAEELFADRAFDAVSVRDITARAGVRLNLLAYYFKTKQALFEKVIDRRLAILNRRRHEVLHQLLARSSPPSVEDLLAAFIKPYLELAGQGDPGWVNYTRLIAQLCQADQYSPLMEDHMSETLSRFLDAFSLALPGVDRSVIRRGFYYAIALMVASFSGVARIDGLLKARISGEQLEAAYRPLLTYTVAGINAVCRSR
jgi:AcrR family transcriptional regulator